MVYLIENHIQKNENYAQTQKKGQAFGKKETPKYLSPGILTIF